MVETFRPANLGEALDVRQETGAIPLAGGTDLMVQRKRWSGLQPGFEKPVMFIGHLAELKGFAESAGSVTIGAACTLSELLGTPAVPAILKEAIVELATCGIRNRATIGGNICNASPAGDTLPPLYALNTMAVLVSKTGERTLPVRDLILGPGQTCLKDDELLKEIIIPDSAFNRSRYRKVGTRKANALSKLVFLGVADVGEEQVRDVRLAFGSVAPTVVRSRDIELQMAGKSVPKVMDSADEIAAAYSPLIRPITDQRSTAEYRKTVSLNLLRRFLREEIGKANRGM